MVSTLALDLSDLARLQDLMQAAPEIAQEELMRFGHATVMHLEAEVKDRTPTGAHQLLRQSIAGTVSATPTGILGVVGTPSPYGPSVEHGTKPHWAPLEPLVDWVKAKLPVGQTLSIKSKRAVKTTSTDIQARQVAKRIQYKIAHHGTQGAHMFEETQKANETQIRDRFRATVERIAARIGGAS